MGGKSGVKRFWGIKPEIRVVGIDDGRFDSNRKGQALLVGAVFRGGLLLEGVLSTWIWVDGHDATERIVQMINRSKHRGQLRLVMSDGLTFAGFNVMDIKEVCRRTGLPVIAVTRERPDMEEVKRALKHLPDWRGRWKLFKAAGRVYPVRLKGGTTYAQLRSISRVDAQRVVELTATRGLIPEPVRVAHLIATGISRVEAG